MNKEKEPIFISCKCITYARVNTLEESIMSFLKQDYPSDRCELIIVNDYPLQTLIYDHPQIKIFNLEDTFSTIGDKENLAIHLCKGDIIAVWDDDDIALSNHLQNIAKFWKHDTNLLHWQKGVYYNNESITDIISVGNSGIAYSKRAWQEIGRSPIENAGGDMTMVVKLHNLGRDKVVLANPDDKDVSWFYRWAGNDVYHQSGQGTDVKGKPNIIQRHSLYIEGLRHAGKIPTGLIELKPHWKHYYDKMLLNFIKNDTRRNL